MTNVSQQPPAWSAWSTEPSDLPENPPKKVKQTEEWDEMTQDMYKG